MLALVGSLRFLVASGAGGTGIGVVLVVDRDSFRCGGTGGGAIGVRLVSIALTFGLLTFSFIGAGTAGGSRIDGMRRAGGDG